MQVGVNIKYLLVKALIVSPEAAFKSLVAALAVGNNDGSVRDVDHEVAEHVCQQLLIHQLIDRALPSVKDLDKNSKGAGVGHISSIRYRHDSDERSVLA